MKTHAKKRGTDCLNGSKMWITNGSLADLRVWAMTDEGIAAFSSRKARRDLGSRIQHKSRCAHPSLQLCSSTTSCAGRARVAGRARMKGRCPASAGALRHRLGVIGAAQACLKQLLEYTASRTLFGRPLAANQTIQVRLADMARRITTAQLLALQLGRLKDSGAMQPAHVSLAKWNNCRMALDVAVTAATCWRRRNQRRVRAIRHMLNLESVITYEGTETIHQLTIGRELTGSTRSNRNRRRHHGSPSSENREGVPLAEVKDDFSRYLKEAAAGRF